ncbi:Uncharacterised protein [Serratia liquefaciens]|nr:Uncharacterised protein [Serratia liquefaciens]
MRDALSKFFAKSIEQKLDRKLELFKAGIRDGEKELEQIRTFIVSARRDRDSTLQSKRFEAAEVVIKIRQQLAQFTIIVEYIKTLKIYKILQDGDDPKIIEFINVLIKPLNIDDNLKILGAIDRTLPRLYLSERSVKVFEMYENIVINAVVLIKLCSLPMKNKQKILKEDSLSKSIIELAPLSKPGFEEFGEGYAFHWATYFYNETLRELRNELFGTDNIANDTESAERVALDTRMAQINVRQSLHKTGLSESLLNSGEETGER